MKNLLLLLLIPTLVAAQLRIGVTLHPYYSFVANIVGNSAEVVPIIDGQSNPHGYQVQPEDIKNAMDLDVVVLNGVGHDEFAIKLLQAAGVFSKIPVIYANADVPLLPQSITSTSLNSHTFVSITVSVQQIYTIANELGKINPSKASLYADNARKYARRLRKMKAEYLSKIAAVEDNDFRCATIHGGYSYLLQEFGFQVEAVIEPSHGMNPTASQLKETIEKIKSAKVHIVFSEQDYPSTFINTIKEETGVTVVSLSHLSNGDFTPEFFEKGMRFNLDKLLEAVQDDQAITKGDQHE